MVIVAPGTGSGAWYVEAAAATPMNCRSGIAPFVAVTVMASPLNVPPFTGVKTSYAVPWASFSDVGIVPVGLIGSSCVAGGVGARETRTVNVAMHGARSASEMPNVEA